MVPNTGIDIEGSYFQFLDNAKICGLIISKFSYRHFSRNEVKFLAKCTKFLLVVINFILYNKAGEIHLDLIFYFLFFIFSMYFPIELSERESGLTLELVLFKYSPDCNMYITLVGSKVINILFFFYVTREPINFLLVSFQ